MKKKNNQEGINPEINVKQADETSKNATNIEQEIKLESGNNNQQPEVNATEELQKRIDGLEKEKLDLIEKIKLSKAELINYRKRKDEETASLLKFANQDLIIELLQIIDNFESAIKLASKSENPEVVKYLTGFQMMHTNLLAILAKYGVEVIDRPGQVFDPNLEQALVAENNPELEDDIVIEVLQKGYKLKDRVIRPASVKVNQK